MDNKMLILGGNQLHRGFQEKKEQLGIDEIIVVDWNEKPAYCGDRHIQCDIKKYDEIWNTDIQWDKIKCVYTSADTAVFSQVNLHKRMGYLTPSSQAIENANLKSKMTECWKRAGILNKFSALYSECQEFIPRKGYDYIFKPNHASGSRGITILKAKDINSETVSEAFRNAAEGSLDGNVIVEEFCKGIEFTVEMLGDDYGNVDICGISKKYHTPHNRTNKIAVKLHYNPNDVSDSILEGIGNFGRECYKAIGLKNSFGHLEVILNDDGRIIPIEIGARSSGFIASHLVDAICEESFVGKYAEVIRGAKVNNDVRYKPNKSSMYFFYDIMPGVCKYTTNLTEHFETNKIVSEYFDRSELVAGNRFNILQADHERPGYEILSGDRNDLTISNIEDAEKKMLDCFESEN